MPLARYLPEFGWEPIVLTPLPDGQASFPFRVIDTPSSDALAIWKKCFRLKTNGDLAAGIKTRLGARGGGGFIDLVLRAGGEVIAYPDLCRGWKPFAIRASDAFLGTENVDALLSCSNPVTSSIISSRIKARYKIPWIADFGDLWSQNHDYHYSTLRRLVDRRLELKTLATADALVTVSEPWAEKLRALHRGKPVYSITHGFRPELVDLPPAKLSAKFTITYTGIVYTEKQDPTRLLAALKELVSDGSIDPSDVEVRFYGTGLAWLDEAIEQHGLFGMVRQYERVPKEVALEKQRESQLLLLLDPNDSEEDGIYLGKTLEYLGARRPILAIGGLDHDVIHELLIETNAGRHATTVPDIKLALRELYQEYKLRGEVAYRGVAAKVSQYSYREMAGKFAGLLTQLVSSGEARGGDR